MDGAHRISAKCYRCGEVKPVEEFAWRRKGSGQARI
jgi:hypothetical protein